MNQHQVLKLVRSEIGDAWGATNAHGVDLRKSLVSPERITVINRTVTHGRRMDQPVEVWLVLVEDPVGGGGYRVVFDDVHSTFGLAHDGSSEDDHLVLCGWYGDFMTTFLGM